MILVAIVGLSLMITESGYSQIEKTLDTLSRQVVSSVYVENPDHISNDSLAPKRSSFNAYPYVFYTPESKLAFGAGGMYIFYTDKDAVDLKPSKIGFGGYYTTNKQYKLSVNPNFYFAQNKLYFEMPTSFGFFVNKYWGTGNSAPSYDSAAYSVRTFSSTLTLQIPPRVFAADRTGIILSIDNTTIVDRLGNEFLESESAPGYDGGTVFGIGTDLLWDSRDNIFFPNSGGYQYFKIVVYPDWGDYVFSILELDVKAFRAISPDHVFAFNFYVQSALGETPFYLLPALGGQKRMRGFFYGRYRDNFYAMMQTEYRQYFWRNFGFVVFAGLGDVSSDLLHYRFDNLKYSLGAGLRYKFNKAQKVNLRMDIGFGNDGNRGIYFGIQEAF